MSPLPIIIDTDPGVDDAMAILYALAEPEIDLIGLTSVFGNINGPLAALNALRLVELAGAEVPVAVGASRPRVQDPVGDATYVHGEGGFGTVSLPHPSRLPDPRPAPQFLAKMCAARPGEVTLVAVGPLTNLAAALDETPEIARTVRSVVVMGGAVRCRGNVTPYAEANIWQDPHAAQRVFDAEWPLTLVGLDVTERITCNAADLAPMAERSPRCGAFLADAAAFYFDFHKRTAGIDGCHLHDPAAVIAAHDPSLFTQQTAPLAVTLDGDAIGQTREAETGRPNDICVDADIEGVRARFLSALHAGRLP
ncbi:MAG: nucleoside hydrolase [Pseudomonadota bacterium]